MRSFSEYNPAVLALYFACITVTTMFSGHPAVNAVSLAGAVIFYLVRNGRNNAASHGFFIILFIILSVVNPVISHNGKTVLFVMNDNPVTLEALLYGINSSAAVTGTLYWFRSFSQIMTSEKIMYLTSLVSDRISLVISMTLRFIPLFIHQYKKTDAAQKAAGLYSDDSIPDTVRGKLKVFSVLVTWALENGITTADSMEARGYGSTARTSVKRYRILPGDILLAVLTLLFFSGYPAAVMTGSLKFSFYPSVTYSGSSFFGIAGIISYAVLALLPSAIEAEANIRWKYLTSKI